LIFCGTLDVVHEEGDTGASTITVTTVFEALRLATNLIMCPRDNWKLLEGPTFCF
jgi:hypothetical protein